MNNSKQNFKILSLNSLSITRQKVVKCSQSWSRNNKDKMLIKRVTQNLLYHTNPFILLGLKMLISKKNSIITTIKWAHKVTFQNW